MYVSLGYHAILTVGVAVLTTALWNTIPVVWLAAAYAPFVGRALWSHRALLVGDGPSLKHIGIGEAALFGWWTACGIALSA